MFREGLNGHVFGVTAAVFLATFACTTSIIVQGANAEDCDMIVKALWLDEFAVTASAKGACGQNDVELVIHNSTGKLVWRAAYDPKNLFGFWEIDTPDTMESALSEWITSNATVSSTGTLPEWRPDADGPDHREFPFYPQPGVDQPFYEMTRDFDLSMVCYVQGGESSMCLFHMPDEPLLEPIGVQTFPG